MNQTAAPAETALAATKPRQANLGSAVVLAVFVGITLGVVANQLGHFWLNQAWLNAAFVASASLASIAALAPTLAWTNAILATGLAAAIAGTAQAINAGTGFPFGRFDFTAAAGPRVFGLVPWWLPLAWACIAITARGVSRVFLHGSRHHERHGYRVLGLATLFATFTTSGLEYFATRVAHFWESKPAALLNLSSSLGLHLFIQVAITALLIDKFPGMRPRNSYPFLVWLGINAMLWCNLFATH